MTLTEMLHPELSEHVEALSEMVKAAEEIRPDPDGLGELIRSNRKWADAYAWGMRALYGQRLEALGGAVHCVPFLHPEVCKNLIGMAEDLAKDGGWRKNECEPGPYQIPEIVVAQRDPAMYEVLKHLAGYLNLYYALIYQAIPQRIASIQFTKYSKADTSGGDWHHDLDSDYTAVVSLAPEKFRGGGTDIRLTPTSYCTVTPLPSGYALLFNGRHVHHRGRPVTSGDRYLLTFWQSSN